MNKAYQSSHQNSSRFGTPRPKEPVNKGVTRFSVSQINIETFTVKLLDGDPKALKRLTKALKDLPQEERRFDIKLQKWIVYSSESLRSWLAVTKQYSPLVQWGCRSCDAATLKAIAVDYSGGDQK